MTDHHHAIRQIRRTLCRAPRHLRPWIMHRLVLANGGTWIQPARDGWSTHMVEISLMGIIGFGGNVSEACEQWLANSRRWLDEQQMACA